MMLDASNERTSHTIFLRLSLVFAVRSLLKNRWPYKGGSNAFSIRLGLSKKTIK